MLSWLREDPVHIFLTLFTRVLIILLINPLHECAHAWVASKLGDDTAQCQGRLTLNPIAHIHPVGAICLLLSGFGWANPVPVNPLRFNRKHTIRGGMALTAAAGPISNVLAALVGMIILQVYLCINSVQLDLYNYIVLNEGLNASYVIYYMLELFIQINLGLALFNLIPVHPLDGSRILSFFIGDKFDIFMAKYQQIIYVIFMFALFSGPVSDVLWRLSNLLYDGLEFITLWIPLLLNRFL